MKRTPKWISTWDCVRDGLATGGANRDRTGDLLLAKQALSQLSYGPVGVAFPESASALLLIVGLLVGLGGLEPPTPRLSSVCSNQLSYRPCS